MTPGSSFEQRRLLTRRTYSMTQAGIEYQHRAPFSKFGGTVRFDDLATDLHYWTSGASARWLWAASIFTVFAAFVFFRDPGDGEARPIAVGVLWLIVALFALVRWLIARIAWVGYDPLYLFATRPSAEAVSAFLEAVNARRVARHMETGREMVDSGQMTQAQFEAWQRSFLGVVDDTPPVDPTTRSPYV